MTDERVVFQLQEFGSALRVLGAALLKLTEIQQEQLEVMQRLLAYLERE